MRWAAAVFIMAAASVPCGLAAWGQSSGSRFDLAGPQISVHVQRGDQSLPIATVPNLLPGDKLTLHVELPKSQSVRLILVVAFLRGSTNPPPDNWFTRINTWDKKLPEGITVSVPAEAEQALLFLMPETGGDFSTLKSAVMGRPGTFVRAAQDLNEASFEQARIERYVQALKRVPDDSPNALADHSRKLASTLNLKPNEDCFKKPADQQVTCLRQSGTQLLLDDGHGQTLAAMITSGDSANLIGAMAGTPMATQAGIAPYSAYVGTVIDLVRLMSGIHTAHFQYIPAIAFPDGDALNLRLNSPPSFHNPKSVIVVALPAVQTSVPPPLRLQNPAHVSCLLQPGMVLPLEGAPLVFATGFAHDLVLHLNDGATVNGRTDLPLKAEAFEGGLVLSAEADRKPLAMPATEVHPVSGDAASEAAAPGTATDTLLITGTLHGMWGFDPFSGVTVPLQRLPGGHWTAAKQSDLIAGRTNDLRLHADGTACAATVSLDDGGHSLPLEWKQSPAPNALDVKLPLEKSAPGNLYLLVKQFGDTAPEKVAVTAYSDKTRLEALDIHAGDTFATLSGSGLSNVKSVRLAGTEYAPSSEQSPDGKTLRLSLSSSARDGKSKAKPPFAAPGETGPAEATLVDGRVMTVSYRVTPARPSLDLLNKTVKPDASNGLPLAFTGSGQLPLNARITLALRSLSPAKFPRSEKVEIALADDTLKTTLSLADGSLVLQDNRTALAFLSPAKAFGPSAFGALVLRAVAEDGAAGDWVSIGTLVRTPAIAAFTCARPGPHDDPAALPCQITGRDLFLLEAVSADSAFATPTEVPLGFAEQTLQVPRPADNRTLYLKLRDDPSAVLTVTTPAPLVPVPRRTTAPGAPTSQPAQP